jgi:hypothetical protein
LLCWHVQGWNKDPEKDAPMPGVPTQILGTFSNGRKTRRNKGR